MCFSAQADLFGGLVVGAIGVDVLRHVDHRSKQLMLAALPVLFAAHQLDEAFVWWGLQGNVASVVGRVALWAYLLFAFVVLPVYVPAAVWAVEPPGRRRSAMVPFIGLGALVSGVLLEAMVRGPVTAKLAHYHLSYGTGLRSGLLIVAGYVVATCGSLIFSGYRDIAIFGVVNLVAVAVLARLEIDGFASLWCGWAAVTSGAIALHVRFGRPHGSLAHAAT
ncbi:MAG TPA: DUF6629 family protein [Acidimicrobiales bacterium]|nr:DUF6629 family protein [Acidimicrobiales bacterium]